MSYHQSSTHPLCCGCKRQKHETVRLPTRQQPSPSEQQQLDFKEKVENAKSSIRGFTFALDYYQQGHKDLPTNLMNVICFQYPDADERIIDPWGNTYLLKRDPGNGKPLIISSGPDGKLDTEDDIRSDQL